MGATAELVNQGCRLLHCPGEPMISERQAKILLFALIALIIGFAAGMIWLNRVLG